MGYFSAMNYFDYSLGWLGRFKAIEDEFWFTGGLGPGFVELDAVAL